jgi:hypothetical protein
MGACPPETDSRVAAGRHEASARRRFAVSHDRGPHVERPGNDKGDDVMGMHSTRRRGAALFAIAALVTAACSGDDGANDTTTAPTTVTSEAPSTEPPATEPPSTEPPATDPPATDPPSTDPPETALAELSPADADLVAAVADAAGDGCDPLDPSQCVLPFPSNGLTAADDSSPTGLRLALPANGMPANADGVTVDPAEWNRNDGFSPTGAILTFVADLDADASDLPPWTDPEASLQDDSSVVVVDIATGERWSVFAELDAKTDDPAEQLLKIYPLVPFTEGATYAIGLRGLATTSGDPVSSSPAFVAYRDRLDTGVDTVEARRDQMETEVFAPLGAAGMDRASLQQAWSFTVASTEGIAGRMLHIRDDALASLGDAAPDFEITEVVDEPDDEYIARTIVGSFTVPNYLTGDGAAGNRFFYGDGVTPTADELPVRNGDLTATFECKVSDSTLAGAEPARISQYGHGLLGSEGEVGALNVRQFAFEHNIVFCATKWAGMSEDDIVNAVATLSELSNFPTMADRLQQGVLNQIVLGRLMLHPDGLAAQPAFQFDDGTPLIDIEHLFYDGNSQGGIMGIMLAAVSPDIERAVVGVVGMNYSMLLPRSVDFDTYEGVMIPAYPSARDRALLLTLIQQLWDRGEGAGYVQHVTSDPYPGTEAKPILLHVALGDHQVTELSAFVAARALGADVHQPIAEEGRLPSDVALTFGLDPIEYPSDGSGIVLWDSRSPAIPLEGLPPRDGRDPHEDPRYDVDVREQKSAFLQPDGQIIDVCGDIACPSDIDPRD